MAYIGVIDNAHTEIVHEADPDSEWDRDSTSTSHHIIGITVEKKYGDIECALDVVPEKDYFLLYYLYGTGDSFGSDTGSIRFVCLYDSEALAQKSLIALRKTGESGNQKATIWNELGQKYDEYVDQDYFGGFESAEVETVRLI